MKLPWQKDDKTSAQEASNAASPSSEEPEVTYSKGYTPPKGRPTPTRHEREIAKGVVRDPNRGNDAKRRQRRKELKASMSKDEWKAYKKKEKQEIRERNRVAQKRMESGDEQYLLPRDKGEVRRFVRNWVDSQRFLTEWVMPFALILLLFTFLGGSNPTFANVTSIAAMAFIAVFAIEGITIGRRCNNAVRLKFPQTTEAGFGLGFYAYSRASQPRKWRTPRPQVERGAKV